MKTVNLSGQKEWYDTIVCGDCLNVMAKMPDGCADLVLCDLPYGATACEWDTIIPFKPLWEQYKRITTDNAAIVLTASQPFTSMLVMSNLEMFKYCWVWVKTKAGNFFHAPNMPLKLHEDICVFSKGVIVHKGQSNRRISYNPQGIQVVDKIWSRPRKYDSEHSYKRPSHKLHRRITRESYPNSVLYFGSAHNPPHPTQKPVALFEYLIRTYSVEGNLIFDGCMGSGTTAVAALKLGRHFYGCDINPDYVEMANRRVEKARLEMAQMEMKM